MLVVLVFAATTRQFQNFVIYVALDNTVCIHVFASFPICRFFLALDLEHSYFSPARAAIFFSHRIALSFALARSSLVDGFGV